MVDENEFAKLEVEIEFFIINIDKKYNYDFSDKMKMISVANIFTDGCNLFEDNDGTIIGNITINKDMIKKRKDNIEKLCDSFKWIDNREILHCLYAHIMNHEKYHFKMQNIRAFKLSNECRELSSEEAAIVRSEEKNAELYAIEQTLKKNNPVTLLIALHIENEITKMEIVKPKKCRDYHLPYKEIEKIIEAKIENPEDFVKIKMIREKLA